MTTPVSTDPHRFVEPVIDAEAMYVYYLQHELGAGVVVDTEVREGETFNVPVIRVQQIPGASTSSLILDVVPLDFDIWAKTKSEAKTVANNVRSYVRASKGILLLNAVITDVVEDLSVERRPEDNKSLYRYGCTYEAKIHPA
jgi:hypothetical protein